jgi:hypothetical protein
MTRRILFAFVVAALAACSRAQPGADPIAAVQPIYAPYVENRNPPGLLDVAPWTPELRDLLRSAQEASRETGEPVIDFDPIIDGQDWQIAAVAVTLEAPPADGRAEVAARFNNQGDEVEVIYDLVEADGGWRVDNLRTENWSLRAILATAGIAEGAE